MIVHVILFQPRTNLTESTQLEIMETLASAATAIPQIRRLRVGRRVTHGRPGYEQKMTADFAWAVIVEFDDVDGLVAYLAHPAHGALGTHFTASASDALAYDYEMFDLVTK